MIKYIIIPTYNNQKKHIYLIIHFFCTEKMLKSRENNRIRDIACAVLFSICAVENKQKRRVWVKEYRQCFGHLPLLAELRENYPDDFKNYLRMFSKCFDFLLALVTSKILVT